MRAAAYLRVSTDDQAEDGASLELQLIKIKEYCKENGFKLVRVFRDDGISGFQLNRPELNKLLDEMKNSVFDCVIIYDLTRLSRDPIDTELLIRSFNKHKVSLFSLSDRISNEPEEEAMRLTKGAWSKVAKKKEIEKSKMVMEFKAKQGFVQNRPPFGYKLIGKELVVDDEKAKIVKQIFKEFLDGVSIYVLSKKYGLSSSIVSYILHNPVYIGKFRWKGELLSGKHKAIIDEEVWREVSGRKKKVV